MKVNASITKYLKLHHHYDHYEWIVIVTKLILSTAIDILNIPHFINSWAGVRNSIKDLTIRNCSNLVTKHTKYYNSGIHYAMRKSKQGMDKHNK